MILYKECCICKGQTTLFTTRSAFVVARGREFRVYYHITCIESVPNAKEIITKILNEMTQNA